MPPPTGHKDVRPSMARSPANRRADPSGVSDSRRVARNFLALSLAEVVCRATSVIITLSLARTLGASGYGRVEFAFHVAFWLVLIVRDGFEVIAAREIARHPRLTRPVAGQTLAMKGLVALGLFAGLALVTLLPVVDEVLQGLLLLYGLMLLTTASGLDFVYRGTERMGRIAASLCLRTAIYAGGVWWTVSGVGRINWVPAWLALGELTGIAIIWGCYVHEYGWPRLSLSGRFPAVVATRGRSILTIQVAQTVLLSVDLMLMGFLNQWGDVGLYGAPHRMVTAILTFGIIFQQVIFPWLSRRWRENPESGRSPLDASVRVLLSGLLPLAVGATVLADPLVAFLLPSEYHGAGPLLAIGVWRAPLLTLAFLIQSALIAWSREELGSRLLFLGAIGSVPLVLGLHAAFGLPGAAAAPVIVGFGLVLLGHACLARIGRAPRWGEQLVRPLLACGVMALACRILLQVHVLAAVVGGALVYVLALVAVGGVTLGEVRALLRRPGPNLAGPHRPRAVRGQVELDAGGESW